MKYQHNIIIALLFMGFAQIGHAQTDTTMNKEVEVIKAYQPVINAAVKISDNPKIIDTVNYSPTFDYKIFSTTIPSEKSINPLPVVKLGNPPTTKSNTGFAKIGAGNAFTPYAEVFINSAVSKKTDFGLQLMHFSTSPNIKLSNLQKVKAPYSEDLAAIFMKNNFRKAVLSWDVEYKRNGYRYYGFPGTDSLLYFANIDSTFPPKQALNTAAANFNLKNTNATAKLKYDLDFGYDFLWTATGQKEHAGKYSGDFDFNNRKINLISGSKIEYFFTDSVFNQYDFTKSNHQFVHVAVSPQYVFAKKKLVLKAGLNLGTIIDNDTSAIYHISPKIDFEYHPIDGILTLFAGTDGGFEPNNMGQALVVNPYINYSNLIRPSELAISIFGGLKGTIAHNFAYVFDVDYAIRKNDAFYSLTRSDYTTKSIVNNLFVAEYGDVNRLRLGGNLRYSSTKVTVALAGNYYRHNSKNIAIFTHQPSFDVRLNSSVQLTKKIKTTLDATVIGPRDVKLLIADYTYLPAGVVGDPLSKFTQEQLKTIIDINLGVEYSYSKKLNFFAKANNLLNQNYQQWQGYNQPGLLIMLGASYTF
jgi:hypothetical protein